MITMVEALPVGYALRLFLAPPSSAKWWRILRRTVDAFTGPDDTGATLVVDEATENVIVDTGIQNATLYFYRAYYWDGAAWTASATNYGTAASTYVSLDIDPLTIVRDRLKVGLSDMVARGMLKPHSGVIPVMTAPFASAKEASFPCVSVHLDSDGQSDSYVATDLQADMPDGIGGTIEGEGWHNAVTLNVVGVSLNPDERIALRKAIKAIIIANIPVFSAKVLNNVQFSQRDNEDFTASNAALYITSGSFTCTYPSFIYDTKDNVTDVNPTLFAP